jgi:hypothetical protein
MLTQNFLISLILQSRDHFIHQVKTLPEKFICAVSGGVINLKVTFLAQQ